MQIPLQIAVRDFPQSEALEATIRKKAGKLGKYYPRITSFRVTVEESHQHHFLVSLDVRVPGTEIVVNHVRNEDVYVATRDAFNAARRQLDEAGHLRRDDTGRSGQPVRHTVPLRRGSSV
ncbi:MAG: hypothetical protein A3H32_17370 [Betaproteobacteria bacterium RIFCSPLOWO2_02_FULL_63_19]|nr:MAG: hypothetical protein A3H32_17370 [Betaproteobacteria bacterium RIFCSPLOWO2_02_FULL_63_19]